MINGVSTKIQWAHQKHLFAHPYYNLVCSQDAHCPILIFQTKVEGGVEKVVAPPVTDCEPTVHSWSPRAGWTGKFDQLQNPSAKSGQSVKKRS